MRRFNKVFLLIIAVFAVYYPSIYAGYNSVDDMRMINSVANYQDWSLRELLFPQQSYYYRPILMLTFLVDGDLWGFHPSVMHLENVLIHLGNALLVYLVAKIFFNATEHNGVNHAWLPFFAALLFAWHPINVESVNWISGRSDPLACSFVLISLFFIFKCRQSEHLSNSILAAVFFLLGCLAKETVVFFLPAAIYLLLSDADRITFAGLRASLRQQWLHVLIVLSGCLGYFVLRANALYRHDSGLSHLAGQISEPERGLFDIARVSLKVLGFYLKKIIIPWPLNFGIIDVSDFYVGTGLLLIILCLFFILRPTIENKFFLMSACIMSSALLVALGSAAWTPLAERYLYISSAPFVVAGLSLGVQWTDSRFTPKLQLTAVVLLLVVFGGSTLYRNFIWQDNVRLFSDTVEKSPDFVPARNELAAALIIKGRMDEAREQINAVFALSGEKGYSPSYLNKARLLAYDGNFDEARQLLLLSKDKNPKVIVDVLGLLVKINLKKLATIKGGSEAMEVHEQNLESLVELSGIVPSPFLDYRIAKTLLALGRNDEARDYFIKSYRNAQNDAHYRQAAKVLAEKLGGGL